MGSGLRRVSIGSRITGLAIAGAVLSLAVGGTALYLSRQQDSAAVHQSRLLQAQSLANQFDSSVNLIDSFVNANLAFPDQTATMLKYNTSNIAAGEATLKTLRALPLDTADHALVEKLVAPWQTFTAEVVTTEQSLTPATTAKDRYALGNANYTAGAAISTQIAKARATLAKEVAAATKAQVTASHRALWSIALTVALGAVVLVAIAWRVRRSIVQPLTATVSVLHEVARRNYAVRVDVEGHDEAALMGQALDQVLDDVRGVLQSVRDGGVRLEQSATTLADISRDVDDSSREASEQVTTAADASELVRSGVRAAVHGADQMSSAIREIADNAGRASTVAGEAVRTSHETTEAMGKLAASTAQISNVVKLITSIAEQTNLLALNATIESARAGDAGKGFSVVANEVKDLAQSTGRATEDISRLIGAIQTDSGQAMVAIEQISKVVGEIHDYQNAIAGAVEEQTATTNEMAHAFTEAQTSTEAITMSIESVTRTAERTSLGAQSTRQTAEEISVLAGELNALVGRFQLQ